MRLSETRGERSGLGVGTVVGDAKRRPQHSMYRIVPASDLRPDSEASSHGKLISCPQRSQELGAHSSSASMHKIVIFFLMIHQNRVHTSVALVVLCAAVPSWPLETLIRTQRVWYRHVALVNLVRSHCFWHLCLHSREPGRNPCFIFHVFLKFK